MTAGRCDCGASTGPLGVCEDYFHAILAEEQADPRMYPWHAPVVCAYFLQHPGRVNARYLDVQYRMLQLNLDRGLDALNRVAAHQVARNRHGSKLGYDMAPFEAYQAIAAGPPPKRFDAAFSGLAYREGSFVFDGPQAYGRRITAIVEATVRAWASASP